MSETKKIDDAALRIIGAFRNQWSIEQAKIGEGDAGQAVSVALANLVATSVKPGTQALTQFRHGVDRLRALIAKEEKKKR